ncbi:hypothetical protein [Pontibacillus marinus]|uniref:Uncharacterized protein n=1 Tax=Pontibacillus marinus BH030004 = DSM 16465 TaxID=1385511 RepID=A0A0A5FWK4_9BACI|nr:hypothetical protein [Pontibacillus marinus]KGX83403.1 hypothetical protein N783_03820 [Pontibacillus marinus BH030004 = DSM 16465]
MKKVWMSALGIALLLSIYFNMNQYSKGKTYEEYIGAQVANRISLIVHNSFESQKTINTILDKERITKGQAHQLYLNFNGIVGELQELKFLNTDLDKIQINRNDFLKENTEIGNHFMVKYRKMKKDDTEVNEITQGQIDDYNKVLQLVDRYLYIASDTITGIDENGRNPTYNVNRTYVFTSGEWAIYLKKIHDHTHSMDSPF